MYSIVNTYMMVHYKQEFNNNRINNTNRQSTSKSALSRKELQIELYDTYCN